MTILYRFIFLVAFIHIISVNSQTWSPSDYTYLTVPNLTFVNYGSVTANTSGYISGSVGIGIFQINFGPHSATSLYYSVAAAESYRSIHVLLIENSNYTACGTVGSRCYFSQSCSCYESNSCVKTCTGLIGPKYYSVIILRVYSDTISVSGNYTVNPTSASSTFAPTSGGSNSSPTYSLQTCTTSSYSYGSCSMGGSYETYVTSYDGPSTCGYYTNGYWTNYLYSSRPCSSTSTTYSTASPTYSLQTCTTSSKTLGLACSMGGSYETYVTSYDGPSTCGYYTSGYWTNYLYSSRPCSSTSTTYSTASPTYSLQTCTTSSKTLGLACSMGGSYETYVTSYDGPSTCGYYTNGYWTNYLYSSRPCSSTSTTYSTATSTINIGAAAPTTPAESSSSSSIILIGSVVGGVVVLGLIVGLVSFHFVKKARNGRINNVEENEEPETKLLHPRNQFVSIETLAVKLNQPKLFVMSSKGLTTEDIAEMKFNEAEAHGISQDEYLRIKAYIKRM